MYFKRLEIFGFKSFAEKTVLNFEQGITAVVGPNGCGKSNIFDAIRWVLGEQSAKELRGSSMEDVIFNGTDSKAGLGFAEVSLTFSNETKALPIEYNEVTVTRRLFRSGESEYLLNKNAVRLRDISELFMGTGIGAEAYSLVQQGRVDLIVSARPEDRRIIIDEASGITKYKSKRKEALSKLQDTENNLLRLNDIIVEVKRQIGSIERQANKARKYKDEFERLKGLEVKLAEHQLGEQTKEKDSLAELLEDLRNQELTLAQELSSFQGTLSQENSLIEQVQEKINGVYGEDAKLGSQIEISAKQISLNEERILDANANQKRLGEQKFQLQERCQIQQGKIEALKQTLAILEETLKKSVVTLEEKRNSLAAIAQAVSEAKHTIKADEEKILDLTTHQVSIKNGLTEVMKEFQGYLARKRRLELENEKVESEKSSIDSKLSNVLLEIKNCLDAIAQSKKEQEEKLHTTEQLKARLFVIDTTIDNLEKKKLFLNSQKEFIEELRVQYQDLPDPVTEGTFLVTTPPEGKNQGIIGKVKEIKSVDNMRQEYLRQHFPQFANVEFHEIVCETKFIELDPQKITAKIEGLSSEIISQSSQKEAIVAEIKIEEAKLEEIEAAVHAKEKILSGFETQKTGILEESNKLLSELDLVSSELKEARSALISLKAKEDELNHTNEEIDQNLSASYNNIKAQQGVIAAKSQEREDASVFIAQLETETESARDKEIDQRENKEMFEKELTDGLKDIARFEEEALSLQAKKETLSNDISSMNIRIQELSEKRNSLKTVLADYEMQKAQMIERITKVRLDSAVIEEKVEEIKANLHNHQLKSQEISFSEQSIKDRLIQTYKINWDEWMANAASQAAQAATEPSLDQAGQPQAVEINFQELAAQIEQLKKKCDAYGSVNLVAIEEFDELKGRFEFLTKQQSDLISARESLLSTISKINRTTRQMFLDTFTKVSEEFRIYYRMLFGGGDANLLLIDPENPLESGIEIVARPPGKKLQNISLLSGGEKSLTAIALIFGVFKVRPSPFCVLDEIDAALDESNVGRFGYLLKDFAKIAQFIVITHNKKTIAHANVMYGITMQETGVSRIVSVKFHEENKEKEAVAASV